MEQKKEMYEIRLVSSLEKVFPGGKAGLSSGVYEVDLPEGGNGFFSGCLYEYRLGAVPGNSAGRIRD